jgi:hypothetical protein
MNQTMIRMIFTGAFALIALMGAVGLEFIGNEVPQWLVGIIGVAGGYLFGHVQANGINGKKHGK